MDLNGTNSRNLEDIKINVKFKLSALWIAVMFCYVYGDFFTLFVPGRIKNLMDGNSGVGATTPVKLLLFTVLMSMPAIMIFLSLTLKPKVNRLINIILGTFFTVIMVLTLLSAADFWHLFYLFIGTIEIGITLLIVWYAWKWPRI